MSALEWAVDPAAAGSAVNASKPSAGSVLDRHQVSYAIGYRIGSEFADDDPKIDMPTLLRGLKAAYARQPPTVSMPVMQHQLDVLAERMHQQAMASFQRMAQRNARTSAAFMRSNAKKPDVVSLPSGVQYKVLQVGHGAAPTLSSTVVMNYRGSLVNGMEFDSTWAHGKPVTYAVGNMLPGWRKVLPRMHVGAHWKVFIPPAQAYGERGQLPRIGPNEALVFDIQLLGVKP
ncbi:MAG TPA: FKBP-type peptidyl-prolyl cis-trans isomerase [Oleiagrimonas sp.]|nr:FKBP-type peptidyl-prolyl cis-trans isomerase [Oleiagrimonas sp.]